MIKKLCIVSCPIDTQSGYGARSRDFVRSLISLKQDEWNIQILGQRWGNTPWGVLDQEKDQDLISRLTPNIPRKPDVWIQITVPNEFQPVGTVNIGVTAGIETTLCPVEWIQGCNRMDLIITSSKHSKAVFENVNFTETNEQGQPTGTSIKLEKPVEVLFEGFDTEKYGYVQPSDILPSINEAVSNIKEDFAFLFVGHWLQGDIGEDRKNIGLTIKLFLETFKNRAHPPALILKTSLGNNSVSDFEEIKKRVYDIKKHVLKNTNNPPNVYVIHGELTDEEMNHLYNHPKIKAHLNLTKGEGFGRPLLEASLSKKPIIASNWSGHLDFLKPKHTLLVNGKVTKVHPSAIKEQGIMEQAQWFSFYYDSAKDALKEIFKNYKNYKKLSEPQSLHNIKHFSLDKMTEQLSIYLEKHVNLPDLKYTDLPELKEIKLPKIKKTKLP